MSDVESRVRHLIGKSKKKLRKIADDTGIDYQRLRRWYSGDSQILRANDADAIISSLTNVKEKEGA